MRKLLPERDMRVLPGCLTDADAVQDALVAADAKADPARWYCDHPLVDEVADATYVLSKMWGLRTEPTLTTLAEAFPASKVTFRRADTADE